MDKAFYQNQDQIIKYGETFASRNVSGTAPFILTERELGSRMELKRKPTLGIQIPLATSIKVSHTN